MKRERETGHIIVLNESDLNERKGGELSPVLDTGFYYLTFCCAVFVSAIGFGVFGALMCGALPSIERFGLSFLWSSAWNPSSREFGALSCLYGSVMSSVIALLLATPVSVLIAVFLTELAPPFFRRALGIAIDVLAAVPGVVFGMWGVLVFAPFSARYIQPFLGKILQPFPAFQGPPSELGLFNASVVLAMMLLPYMSSTIGHLLTQAPSALKEATYGMGASDWEVIRDVSLRYSWKGIGGVCLLAGGRVLGEVMVIGFLIGNSSRLSHALFAPANTLGSRVLAEFGEAADSLHVAALLELGLLLLLLSVVLQLITQLWLKRIRVHEGGAAL